MYAQAGRGQKQTLQNNDEDSSAHSFKSSLSGELQNVLEPIEESVACLLVMQLIVKSVLFISQCTNFS